MDNIIKIQEMEKLLVAHWTEVIDSGKIMAFTLVNVRDHISDLARTYVEKLQDKSVKISLSSFKVTPEGFILWIEFTVPLDNETAVGTMETILSLSGRLRLLQVVGNLFQLHNIESSQ